MVRIRFASETDKDFWFTLDSHLRESEWLLKVRDKRAYVICEDNAAVGVMRYNLFWDSVPFLTMIHLEESRRGRGIGKAALLFWQEEMRRQHYEMVMTSTQADEQAQHFYRKLGYIDRGVLCFDGMPHDQPPELLLLKIL